MEEQADQNYFLKFHCLLHELEVIYTEIVQHEEGNKPQMDADEHRLEELEFYLYLRPSASIHG